MTKSILSCNLKKLRSITGLNQDALANILGIPRNRIASYESQNVEPKVELLTKISALFKVGLDTLITTEINESNYEDLKATYLAWQEGILATQSLKNKEYTLDTNAVDDFINKNALIEKMVDGMKTFYHFKNQHNELSSEMQQVIYILDLLMSVNKDFISGIRDIKK